MSHLQLTRRNFLRQSAAAAAAPIVLASAGCAGRPAASERIAVGLVGLGAQGFNNLRQFLLLPDVQVVAVCDVQPVHYREGEWGKPPAYGRETAKVAVEERYSAGNKSGTFAGCASVADFRELCARDDLDALVISTPDHWHALVALQALGTSKAVYCEKPLVHRFHEGELICAEVVRRKAVFQTGSQQRSMPVFRRAVEIVRNGHLGRIQRIEVGLPDGYDRPQGEAQETAPPPDLDYEMWTGPAPLLPYMQARHHRWWRGHTAYGGGTLMDWIGHHNDIAEWALEPEQSRLTRVEAVGWSFPETDVYNTPLHFDIRCQYAGGIESSISDRHKQGTKWIGDKGWLFVTRSIIEASDSSWSAPDFKPGRQHVAVSNNHYRNFVDAVKASGTCIAPPDIALRSITPGFLGYVSQALGRPVRWDATRQTPVADPEADKLLRAIDYRSPWTI